MESELPLALDGTVPVSRPVGPDDATLLRDLAVRWTRARRAALRTVVPDAPADAREHALLGLALAADRDATLRRLFDNSRILALGFARLRAVDLTLVDLADALPLLGSPCLVGGFERVGAELARATSAVPCPDGRDVAGLCDAWRESVSGLVSGLSTQVRHTRLESLASGSSRCRDLLHVDAESSARFVPATDAMQTGLDEIARVVRCLDPDAKLVFHGTVEGVIHYRLKASVRAKDGCGGCSSAALTAASSCGPCGSLDLGVVVAHALRRRFPGLSFVETSPRPVLSP